MRKRRLTKHDIALAMELRQEGISWKVIGYHLGFHYDYLQSCVSKAKKQGFDFFKTGRYKNAIKTLPATGV